MQRGRLTGFLELQPATRLHPPAEAWPLDGVALFGKSSPATEEGSERVGAAGDRGRGSCCPDPSVDIVDHETTKRTEALTPYLARQMSMVKTSIPEIRETPHFRSARG